ncbi:MAG: hypothetical protein NWE89_02425 [Candidatus Bathyarchaeota archaeon]|nr:hypothetical protein [Candidatus Bathyarchaeota archaeon]
MLEFTNRLIEEEAMIGGDYSAASSTVVSTWAVYLFTNESCSNEYLFKNTNTIQLRRQGYECVSLGLDKLLLTEETDSKNNPSPDKKPIPAVTLLDKGENQA